MKPFIKTNPFPTLKTNRLLLREINKDDGSAIYDLRSSDEVNRFIDRPKAKTIEDANYFIHFIRKGILENKWLYWAIQLQNKKHLVGTICLWNFSDNNKTAEVGFELLPACQGLGMMHEAFQKIIEFAFSTSHVTKLQAFTQIDNVKSGRLLEKINFKKEANIKKMNGVCYHTFYLNKS